MTDPRIHLQAPEAEERLLSAIIGDSRLLEPAALVLRDEYFVRNSHREVWRAMLALREQDAPIDVLLLADYLSERWDAIAEQSVLAVCGGVSALNRIAVASPSPLTFEADVRTVSERRARRMLLRLLEDASNSIAHGSTTSDVVGKLNDELDGISNPGLDDDAAHAAEIARQILADLDAGEAMLKRCPTGIAIVDTMLDGGLAFGMHTIIGALSGHGKTTIASSIVAGMLDSTPELAVDWYGCEVPPKWQFCRIASAWGDVPEAFWRSPDSARDTSVYRKAVEALGWGFELKSRLRIFHCPAGIDMRDVALKTAIRRRHLGDRPLLVVVDYIQRAHAGESWKTNERIAEASKVLAGLADERTLTLALSQFTEEASQGEPIPIPKPAQARWAKDIHHDACDWLTYHRPCHESQPPVAMLQLAKSRYGQLGHVWLLGSPSNRFGSFHEPGSQILRACEALYPEIELRIPDRVKGLHTVERRP